MRVIKRDGRTVEYDRNKILIAIRKANAEVDTFERVNDDMIDGIVAGIEMCIRDRRGVVDADFAHVTYTEAIKLLEEHNDKFEYKVSWGCDLQTEHERYLTEEIFKRPVLDVYKRQKLENE